MIDFVACVWGMEQKWGRRGVKWQEHPYTPRQVCLVITVQDGSYIEIGRLGFAYSAQRETAACTDSHRTLSLSFLHFLSLLPLFSFFLGLLSSTAPLPSHILTHTFSLPFPPACLPDNSIINWPIWPTLLINSSHQGSLLFFACCWAGITISWTTGDLEDWVIKKKDLGTESRYRHTLITGENENEKREYLGYFCKADNCGRPNTTKYIVICVFIQVCLLPFRNSSAFRDWCKLLPFVFFNKKCFWRAAFCYT